MPPASTQLSESIASIVDSQEHLIDKAQRLQDECIKADQNCFVTWDQWTKSKQSLMPSHKKTAKELAKEHFGHEKFDMCWGTKSDKPPSTLVKPDSIAQADFRQEQFDMCWGTGADKALTVETPNVGPLAKPHFGMKTFDMCWDAKVDPAPIIATSTAEPQPTIQYNLCWDDTPMASKVNLALMKTKTYDMCWEETPALAVGYEANFDMCWGDLPLGTDGDYDSALTWHGLPSQIVEGSEELLH
ncbi:uncharacterized protein BJ212DRAFT_1298314 [Suillus subaureus]|uniref:Uncharacterized protein n=1 Tax=Suillus subaureus TaxID=48587 RepID=A0A9P7EED1_9AGAM|nr:uncharacterized protein BJ212DRAFT_1298314 [Suillus subaureus]KAG1819022.1 hypothetical protein BJ212DRAFT_1298314 [Suillus subaureus]